MLSEKQIAGSIRHLQQDSVLRATGLHKSYGATVALERADICLHAGTVHALLGENGAGKSTLVRILAGAVSSDMGEMDLDGRSYRPYSLMDARANGVATAFQELSLISNLSVAQNLLLPNLPKSSLGLVSARRTLEMGSEVLARHGLERINPKAEVSQLPLADRQRIEIARAIENARRVLILDEPTASLAETDWLFERIAHVIDRGVAVLYISHRLGEVREICTKATVLRNGSSIASVDLLEAPDNEIFEMMVGRKVTQERLPRVEQSDRGMNPRLTVKQLTGPNLHDVNFQLYPGEILGVAALEGQGQQALFRMLAGIMTPIEGQIFLDGQKVSLNGPRAALKAGSGIAYLPEERKTEGILSGLSAATNIVLPIISKVSLVSLITPRREMKAAKWAANKVEMNPRYLGFAIGDLSGGNQQKALLARTLVTGAKTLLLFDPSRGVDVGTKQSIYQAIRTFTDEGGSVLFYSSELPEVVELADRCFVLYGGQMFREFERDEISEKALVTAMLGHDEANHREGANQ